ncbi:hypothetical protein EMIHUDRAFT_205723 [Emiliania huxleyi CCMP1516]|uniref:EGF-like domain-containing protein n=4 Tax=Emiliania huxleyi TaxID=2903 RepID=A0A0D3JSX3_EMIH1|nr:hypothetical protein EMIHUDRAFT_205723 [Emiliania huxleyi CCMP1516]EOD26608.1 hypothetical protein EMIHUDRAFT_205723 [Emiliania huxleyi CCMP1516]|eukprot:XP_005779037.1 hypothetical protein EMIHUDRAFT_205723 [Emiliania huxleyi CCMP1516]
MLTIPTLSAAHKKGVHTMQAIGLLADMGHDGTAAHRGQGVQRDMPGVACNVTGGGGRCEQLQFGRYTAVGHCDCGPHGVCEPLTGECLCQWGWAGKQCEVAAFPACGLGAELSRAQLAASCASMRLLSPVACACLAQCLDAGHEARLTTLGRYLAGGRAFDSSAPAAPAELPARKHLRGVAGGTRHANAARAGSCEASYRCVCVDGAFGDGCESICSNDCFNGCSGHGTCVHGWCQCDAGWYGVDCSDAAGLQRSALSTDPMQFGDGTTRAQLSVLPVTLRPHLRRLRRSVYVYQMPASVNRAAEAWMWRQWGKDAGRGCDPVHNRRIYSAQSHFDAHLLHDDFTRTLDPKRASLFYVPLFLNQRVPWGADLNASMSRALQYIRTRHPWWNASSGRDHVWFVFGERQTCLVPPEIAKASIIVGHWGDEDCMSPDKDVVVPTITPVQHDYPRFVQGRDGTHSLQRSMRGSAELPLGRSGPLVFFAGGITSFGASQDNLRKGGIDSQEKQEKWLKRVTADRCARPDVSCRQVYSMGVRQAIWREKLYAEPDMRIVSAGVPDYFDVVTKARFCIHTEGNGWGARVVDYMAMECLPLMVNDRMIFPYANVLPWEDFAIHLRKDQIPALAATVRNISQRRQEEMRTALRLYKAGFVWWRPDGAAYEFTLAALGQRVEQLGLGRAARQARARS